MACRCPMTNVLFTCTSSLYWAELLKATGASLQHQRPLRACTLVQSARYRCHTTAHVPPTFPLSSVCRFLEARKRSEALVMAQKGSSAGSVPASNTYAKRNWEGSARAIQDKELKDESLDQVLVAFLSPTIPGGKVETRTRNPLMRAH